MKPLLSGVMDIRFISGNRGDFLSRLNRRGIPVFHLSERDELTAHCRIRRVDYGKVLEIALRTGTEVSVLGEYGIYRLAPKLLKRWVFVVGILILLVCTSYLPGRVLFVQVKGNSAMPNQKIIETAESCGIYFGATRKDVRSEKVKNALISALPELQWVGVNTRGCVAEISVREKSLPELETHSTGVSSIVAVTDGIIRDITVTQGNALCKVGQAVKKGQVIISGYTDCGRLILGTQAQGEVYGETRRSHMSVTPILYTQRTVQTGKKQKFSLQIGKKLIKFYNDSGISHTSCVKMYEKKYLTLPGGFRLPVALITETVSDYTLTDVCTEDSVVYDWLSQDTRSYLLRQTVAGKLLASDEHQSVENDILIIQGNYTFYEMIGRIQNEESILRNGSNG